MPTTLRVASSLLLLTSAALWAGCLFGGEKPAPSASRPGSIPTATQPATLPAPILVGEALAVGGSGQSTPSGGGQARYTVKSGDTLGGIASQFGVPVGQQASWIAEVLRVNGIADPTLLRAGQELILPAASPTPRVTGTPPTATQTRVAATATTATTATVASTAASTATPRPTVTGGGGTYTVVSGDYPLLIAQKLGVPESQQLAWADALTALNNVSSTGLQVGMVLQLPAGTPSSGGTATPTRTP